MGKVFNYTKTDSIYIDDSRDEVYEDCSDFQYEVSWQDIKFALIDIIFSKYFKNLPQMMDKKEHVQKCRATIEKFISDTDSEEYLVDAMEEDLKEYFEADAFASLKD